MRRHPKAGHPERTPTPDTGNIRSLAESHLLGVLGDARAGQARRGLKVPERAVLGANAEKFEAFEIGKISDRLQRLHDRDLPGRVPTRERREAHPSQSAQSAERGEVRDLGKMDEAQILQPNQTGDWFEIGVWVSSHHKRPNVWVAMQLRQ
jgi:hypothetical protein